MTCRICSAQDEFPLFVAREMMFGFQDKFSYFQCKHCGCLQLSEQVPNISKYYPADYYSFEPVRGIANSVKTYLKQKRANHLLGKKNLIGAILAKISGEPEYIRWLKKTGMNESSEILDVGSGGGELLQKIMGFKFKKLVGVDPFVSKSFALSPDVEILKTDLRKLEDKFDLIMLHHSLEHIWDQRETIQQVSRLLKSSGKILIRVPLVSSYAWEKYGVNWVQLDAPRHFYLHSAKSLEYLLAANGLKIDAVDYDSYDFQFWGSELYSKNIPLKSDQPFKFSKDEMLEFRKKSTELNSAGQGDQACFYVSKV